jgi:hypothetical protein
VQRLVDLIVRLPSDGTIFARRPWGPDSDAVIGEEGQEPAGYDYLLECEPAEEVISVWAEWRGGRSPTPTEATEAVIHYATTDAYMPTE